MNKAYEEVKLCLANEKHNLSTETLQLCLEALRIAKDQKHNGYTNYPTWIVASTIDNNEDLYKAYQTLAAELMDSNESEYSQIGILAQSLKFDITTHAQKLYKLDKTGMFESILNDVVMEQVNYHEIAKNIIE